MTIPSWVKGTVLLAVTFAAGAAAGVAWEHRRAPAQEAAALDAHHVMLQIGQELGLDSAQHAQVAAILARHQAAVDSTWHTLQPRVREMMDSAHREILGVLRPEQMEKFRKMATAMHGGAR